MPISTDHVKLLESYRDKAYITSILCAQSSEHFEFLRSMVNLPLILSSSVFTVLNSIDSFSLGFNQIIYEQKFHLYCLGICIISFRTESPYLGFN